MSTQNTTVHAMLRAAERGIAAVGVDSGAGRRLATMRNVYTHLMRELPAVIDRRRPGRKESGREER